MNYMYNFECCQYCGIVFNLKFRRPSKCPNCNAYVLYKEKLIKRNAGLLKVNEILIKKNK